MLTYLRCALATVCFAMSVACFGLWWRSYSIVDKLVRPVAAKSQMDLAMSYSGTLVLGRFWGFVDSAKAPVWKFRSYQFAGEPDFVNSSMRIVGNRRFAILTNLSLPGGVYFPLWYAALVFALFGIGALRLGRRFTLRSVIIATTVVAGLLGIVVAL